MGIILSTEWLTVSQAQVLNLSDLWVSDMLQARPLLDAYAIRELVDPQLGNKYSEHEVYCMLHAASLCIRRDPQARPRMSRVRNI